MRKNIFLILAITVSVFAFSADASAQQRFVASVTGPQEVPDRGSTGTGLCQILLNAAETSFTVNCTYRGLTSSANAGHIHINGPVGVNSPVRFNFGTITGTSGTIGPLMFNVTPAEVADLRAKGWYVNIRTINFPGGEIRGQVKIVSTPADLDGDGRTNIRVFRPGATTFYTLNNLNSSMSTNVFTNSFAGGGAINSASDDYDGDGRGDLVLIRAVGDGLYWRILQTATNTVREVQFGSSSSTVGDQPLPADYDGDGKTDIAVFRRSTGFWYILQSSNNQLQAEGFGQTGDIGMVGDFDKDGKSDLTIIRGTPNGLGWFTRRSSDRATQVVFFGGAAAPGADFIFPAAQVDIDGDGIQDRMVVRDPNNTNPQTGDPRTIFILRSSNNTMFTLQWGIDTDTMLFGDYDGDGKTDIVARRAVSGQLIWFIYQSLNGQARIVPFGAPGDQ